MKFVDGTLKKWSGDDTWDRKKQIIQKRFSPVINPDTISIVYLFIMVQQAMQIMQTIMPDPTKLKPQSPNHLSTIPS